MSLATTSGMGGGGAGGGGLMMAHQAGGHQQHAPPPPIERTGPSGAPIFMGADLADKNQSLTAKQVKNVSHLPLVGIDLHAPEPHVAYYPPKPEDPSHGATPVLIGKMKPNVYFKATEVAHKTLRKFLAESKTYLDLSADSLTTSADAQAVVLHKPHLWLGLRRLEDAPEFYAESQTTTQKSHAIDQDVQGVGAQLVNSTLDGKEPTGDDFDRVVWKVRLTESKKALPILPEEAVQTLLHQAQYHVATRRKTSREDEEIVDYPCAVALPAWSFHDAAVEALLEACPSGAVIFPRSMCALTGALLPPAPDGGKASPLLQRVLTVRQLSQQEFQKQLAANPNAVWEDEVTIVMVGMTEEGMEATAIQVSSENGRNIAALFSDYKVISNVAYQSKDPLTLLQRCASELEANVDKIASEADGPTAIVFYGCPKDQEKLTAEWEKIKSSVKEWDEVPVFTTKSDVIALGAAVLGAVSHGRCTRIRSSGNKARPEMAIQVHDVAPVAVGVRLHYHGDKVKWSSIPVKTIFDFDRRIPAGPFAIDLNAAECAAHRQGGTEKMSSEELQKATAAFEGSKGIPKREEAALNLRLQVVQKWTRDGEWRQVGDIMKPLVYSKEADDKEKEFACESVALELSLGVNGMITSSLVGERQTVVQATVSARKSTIRFWLGIGAAVLFFGGFLVRSYYEEYAFKRDVKRLLAYYKHVVPGSLSDGDEHNARYLVWKYRNKKDSLWRVLEKKYGHPVLKADEWDDEGRSTTGSAPEEAIDLDEKRGDADGAKSTEGGGESDEL